jgi:hypothetical protein
MLRPLARPSCPSLLSRHSDKRKSNCRFNAGLRTHMSEWSLILLRNHTPLNQRVPGSSPWCAHQGETFLSNALARDGGREQTGLVRRFLWRTSHGQIAARLFLCFCIFTPFDTARSSDGTGRLRARRRIGYLGEQNGQTVLPVAGYRLLQNQNRIVRVGGSICSPLLFPTISYAKLRFLRSRTLNGSARARSTGRTC